jgi:hypothetical protein
VMRAAGDCADGARLRALIVILWRAGLRIGEALDLAETDLDESRGAVLVRRGKGGRRREVRMDRWAWSQLEPWMSVRRRLPVGALLCVIRGATAGRHWESSSARKQLARTAAKAGCAGGSRRTNSATRTPWRWRMRARLGRHPAPARARQPRHHIDLSAGDRQLRDHPGRPFATRPGDFGYSWPRIDALGQVRRVGDHVTGSLSARRGEGPGLSGLEVSLREKSPPERGERCDSVVTVVGRVVAATEFVEQVCPVGRHQ